MRERQQKKKYAKAKERARQFEKKRLQAMEMMLGARWDSNYRCFINQVYDETGRGVVTTFYDRVGNKIDTQSYQEDMKKFVHGEFK